MNTDTRFQLGKWTYQIAAYPVDLSDAEELASLTPLQVTAAAGNLFADALQAAIEAARMTYLGDWEIVSHDLTQVDDRLVITFLLRCPTSSRAPRESF